MNWVFFTLKRFFLFFRVFGLFFIFSAFWFMLAQAASSLGFFPEISSDEPIIFDKKTASLVAKKNATLAFKDNLLGADTLTFLQNENKVVADSNVFLNNSRIRAIAKAADYTFVSKELNLTDFKLYSSPIYIEGPSLSAKGKAIKTEKAVVYLGQADPFCLNIYAKEAEGDIGGSIRVRHGLLRIGKVPVFWLPRATFQEYPFAISQEAGKSEIGGYLRNSIFYKPKHPSLKKVGFLLDFYDTTGVFFGPAYNYNSPLVKSNLRSGYLRDGRIDRKLDSLKNDIPKDRYAIEFRHNQEINDNFTVVTKVSAWSDSEILRHTRPRLYNKNRAPDNFVEGVSLGENYIFSAFTRFRPNNFLLVQQRLPELSFHYLPTQVGKTKIYQESKIGMSNILEKGVEGQINPDHVYKMDAYYGLRRPFCPSDWMSIVPLVGLKVNRYGKYEGDDRSFSWISGEFGFDLEFKSYKIWDYHNKTWQIDQIRHILKPIVQYRVLPMHKTGNASLAQIDREVANTHMDPLDLAQARKIDPNEGGHILRLGLNNILQTKTSSVYSPRDLANLSVVQDVRCSRKEGQKTLSYTHTTFSFSPAYWLDFDCYHRLNPYSLSAQELTTRTAIKNGDEWTFSFTTTYLKEETLQYGLNFRYNFTVRHAVSLGCTFNEKTQQVTSQTYKYITKLGHNWDLVISAGFSKNTSLVSHEKYAFALRWKP